MKQFGLDVGNGGDASGIDFSGNFYICDRCTRCGGKFYTYALQNMGMGPHPTQCYWCRGECSASEQQRKNDAIEMGNIPIKETFVV